MLSAGVHFLMRLLGGVVPVEIAVSLCCPYCGEPRFTRLTPPFTAVSEVQCAACLRKAKLSELRPECSHEPSRLEASGLRR